MTAKPLRVRSTCSVPGTLLGGLPVKPPHILPTTPGNNINSHRVLPIEEETEAQGLSQRPQGYHEGLKPFASLQAHSS